MRTGAIVIKLHESSRGDWKHWVLLALIIALGMYARAWGYRSLASGLNQDEASAGVEAMSLYRYGTDRHGVSFPTRFISWGSGQDALYAYMLVPLIAVAGLSPTVVRLPMLFVGLLSLPLIYFVGRKLGGRNLGMLAMFLLAISPWHIAISRRAGDTNLFPFLFLVALAFLLKTDVANRWFTLACLVLSVSLYAYWTSYLIVPVFALISFPYLYAASRVSRRDLIAGVVLLVVLATPAALYMIVNILELPSVQVGPLTIPRFPSVSRIGTDVVLFQPAPLQRFLQNAAGFLGMIVMQSEGPACSTCTGYPFGFLYRFTSPLIVVGAMVAWGSIKDAVARRLLVAWLAATATLGLVISPVFLHNNALIPALILLCSASLEWLMRWHKTAFVLTLAGLLVAFALFSGYSRSSAYTEVLRREYNEGLLPALDYARRSSTGPICVDSTKILQPEIFVMFSENAAPSVGSDMIVFDDPGAQFLKAKSVGRYFFGSDNCPPDAAATYVLPFRLRPPVGSRAFSVTRFDGFKVLVPK